MSGEQPRWKSGSDVRVCPQCGETFRTWPRQRKTCCSQTCSMRRRQRRPQDNPRYNGGLCFDTTYGRWLIVCIDGTTMPFYRGVMAAELGRLLEPDEIVHHINGNQADDRLENLTVMRQADHIELHREDMNAARRAALV